MKNHNSLITLKVCSLDEGVSDSTFESLISKPSLRYLEISDCEGVSLEFAENIRQINSKVNCVYKPFVQVEIRDVIRENHITSR